MQKIVPFLWFHSGAEQAMNYYLATFKNSEIAFVSQIGADDSTKMMKFSLDGLEFYALDGGDHYTIGPGISLFVNCETQEEIDHYWSRLSDGGQVHQCGWLTDKFGITWQIVPTLLGRLMGDPDREKSQRVMQAMMQMVKFDIAGLQKAYDG